MTSGNTFKIFAWLFGAAGCAALILAALWKRLPISWTEAVAFSTGLWCVALVAQKNVWNFPIGLLNNAFFAVVFYQARLFNDMALQFVFFAFGVAGWYSWLHGGTNRTKLPISRAPLNLLAFVAVFVVVVTPILMRVAEHFNGAAPFWDALVTAMSLGAQFLLNGKRVENWYLWMLVDAICVPLFVSRGLYLSAALYACFFALCVAGLQNWKRELFERE